MDLDPSGLRPLPGSPIHYPNLHRRSMGAGLRNLLVQVLKPNDHAVADLKLACPVFTLYDFVDTLPIVKVGGYHGLQSRWRLAFHAAELPPRCHNGGAL